MTLPHELVSVDTNVRYGAGRDLNGGDAQRLDGDMGWKLAVAGAPSAALLTDLKWTEGWVSA